MRTQYQASCFASGHIFIGEFVPDGAVAIASGPSYRELEEEIEIVARHGYEKGVLLVPGVPEAGSVDEAINAVARFVSWAGGRENNSMWRCPEEVREDLVHKAGLS